jgi:hypothetical protein
MGLGFSALSRRPVDGRSGECASSSAYAAAVVRRRWYARPVTSELLLHGDDEPDARCAFCGKLAVGPCARCDAPVCGDCCVLTDGGARVYAICLGCDRRGGRSLRRAWLTVGAWIAGPLVALTLAVLLLAWISQK